MEAGLLSNSLLKQQLTNIVLNYFDCSENPFDIDALRLFSANLVQKFKCSSARRLEFRLQEDSAAESHRDFNIATDGRNQIAFERELARLYLMILRYQANFLRLHYFGEIYDKHFVLLEERYLLSIHFSLQRLLHFVHISRLKAS